MWQLTCPASRVQKQLMKVCCHASFSTSLFFWMFAFVCIKVKGKGSSLDIPPLTILDTGVFTTSEVAADWH